jgi:hypothetical protein
LLQLAGHCLDNGFRAIADIRAPEPGQTVENLSPALGVDEITSLALENDVRSMLVQRAVIGKRMEVATSVQILKSPDERLSHRRMAYQVHGEGREATEQPRFLRLTGRSRVG